MWKLLGLFMHLFEDTARLAALPEAGADPEHLDDVVTHVAGVGRVRFIITAVRE